MYACQWSGVEMQTASSDLSASTSRKSFTSFGYFGLPEPIAPSPMYPTATRSFPPFTLPVKRDVVKAPAAVARTSRLLIDCM